MVRVFVLLLAAAVARLRRNSQSPDVLSRDRGEDGNLLSDVDTLQRCDVMIEVDDLDREPSEDERRTGRLQLPDEREVFIAGGGVAHSNVTEPPKEGQNATGNGKLVSTNLTQVYCLFPLVSPTCGKKLAAMPVNLKKVEAQQQVVQQVVQATRAAAANATAPTTVAPTTTTTNVTRPLPATVATTTAYPSGTFIHPTPIPIAEVIHPLTNAYGYPSTTAPALQTTTTKVAPLTATNTTTDDLGNFTEPPVPPPQTAVNTHTETEEVEPDCVNYFAVGYGDCCSTSLTEGKFTCAEAGNTGQAVVEYREDWLKIFKKGAEAINDKFKFDADVDKAVFAWMPADEKTRCRDMREHPLDVIWQQHLATLRHNPNDGNALLNKDFYAPSWYLSIKKDLEPKEGRRVLSDVQRRKVMRRKHTGEQP
mmetsp:Transcript_47146/g.102596  ORF Transcript_47146/g.102596 Transcript_47146/m.102596 type:complete len:422 (-) Transcript_47146:28-1293(-)